MIIQNSAALYKAVFIIVMAACVAGAAVLLMARLMLEAMIWSFGASPGTPTLFVANIFLFIIIYSFSK